MAKCVFCSEYIADLWRMGEHVRDTHPAHSFKCPRQDENPIFSYPEHAAFWRDDGTCSHCGSMRPEAVLKAARDGAVLGPTNKSYKVYVGNGVKKFYFQHFSVRQQEEFVGLLNDGRVVFDNPGGFYVLPFFIRKE